MSMLHTGLIMYVANLTSSSGCSQAKQATSLHALVVATDDERIAKVCRAAGAQVVMTSDSCPNGEHCHATLRHHVLIDCRRLAVSVIPVCISC